MNRVPGIVRGMSPRTYRDLAIAALEQGWTATATGQNHIRLDPPPGWDPPGPVFCGFSAKGGRSTANFRSVLRRHGVKC